MPESKRGSVSLWLKELRAGDSCAAQQLWERYFGLLAPIARTRLAGLDRDRSGEDIALSALKSVITGVQEDRFAHVGDRDNLWPLLVTITARKAISERRRQLAGKRSAERDRRFDSVEAYIGAEPTAEFAAEVADELSRLVEALGDPLLQRLVELKLAGCTNEEVARELGCAKRTVIRKLHRVREEWTLGVANPQPADG